MDASQEAIFVYPALPTSRHVRLLEIAHANEISEPIRATLQNADLDDEDCLPYVALSYTWGSPDFSQTLLIDDSICYITPNVAAALRHFRQVSSLKRIWIDAISINQKNDAEKSVQIPLMADIFRDASKVMVWLGSHPNDVRLLKELRRISRQISRFGKLSNEEVPGLIGLLRSLSALQWFSRRWIIQEIVLSPSVSFFCGHIELALQRLIEVFDYAFDGSRSVNVGDFHTTAGDSSYRKSSADSRREIFGSELRDNARINSVLALWSLWEFWSREVVKARRNQSEQQAPTRIIYLLSHFNGSECSDDRDRIYALLGLAADVKSSHHSGAIDFDPDYSQTAEQVYMSFAKELIRQGNLLQVLSIATSRRHRRHKGLPSWVPDWTAPKTVFEEAELVWPPLEPVSIRATPDGKYHKTVLDLLCVYCRDVASSDHSGITSAAHLRKTGKGELLNTNITQFRVICVTEAIHEGRDWATSVVRAIFHLWEFVLDTFDESKAQNISAAKTAFVHEILARIMAGTSFLRDLSTPRYFSATSVSDILPASPGARNEHAVPAMAESLREFFINWKKTYQDFHWSSGCIFLCCLNNNIPISSSNLCFMGSGETGISVGDAIISLARYPSQPASTPRFVVRPVVEADPTSDPSLKPSEDGYDKEKAYKVVSACSVTGCVLPQKRSFWDKSKPFFGRHSTGLRESVSATEVIESVSVELLLA